MVESSTLAQFFLAVITNLHFQYKSAILNVLYVYVQSYALAVVVVLVTLFVLKVHQFSDFDMQDSFYKVFANMRVHHHQFEHVIVCYGQILPFLAFCHAITIPCLNYIIYLYRYIYIYTLIFFYLLVHPPR